MLKRAFLALTVVFLASFVLSSASWAGFRVCNHSSQRVDVAFGYPHEDFGWTSEGWWVLQPEQCRTIMRGDLSNQYYYLYATGSEGAVWKAPEGQDGGFFCIQRDKFLLPNRDFKRGTTLNCGAHDLTGKQFFIVDTEGAPNHVHNLRD
jgi:uncharacterized membrane protein